MEGREEKEVEIKVSHKNTQPPARVRAQAHRSCSRSYENGAAEGTTHRPTRIVHTHEQKTPIHPSLELQNKLIDLETRPRVRNDAFNDALLLRSQNVLHLHRFDDG